MSDPNPPGYTELLRLVYKFLGFRPRTHHEIHAYLQKKKAPRDTEEKIVAFLMEQNLINDREFADWWIDQRTRFRPKGQMIIRMELKQKGVPDPVIDAALTDVSKEARNEAIQKFIEKYLPKYRSLPKREIYQKLGALLQRRGFDWETIKHSLDDALKEGV